MQDETRRRGGEKAKADISIVLEKMVSFYAKEVLNKPERGIVLFQDLMMEVNPIDKK